MKRFSKLAMTMLLLAVMMFVNTCTVLAEGTTTIYLSTNDSIGVGDTISITIKGSDSASMKVLYTDSVLNFVSCTNDSYKTDGNAILYTGKEATIKFSGVAEGKANVIVSSDALTGSSAQVVVTGSAPADVQTEETPEEPTETSETSETSDGGVEVTEGGVVLSGAAMGSITVVAPEAVLSPMLVEAPLVLQDGTTATAYRLQNTDSAFYYVYGMAEDGSYDWYSYDSAHQTLQHADQSLFTSLSFTDTTVSETEEVSTESATWRDRAKQLYQFRKLILILMFVIGVALIVLLNIRMKRHDEEYDDDEGDFFAEYGEAQEASDAFETGKKRSVEPEVKTVIAGKDELVHPQNDDISADISAALEATVLQTEAEATREVSALEKLQKKSKPAAASKQETDADFDLSDAIVKQVTKPSNASDDLKIIDFNDL